MDRGIALISTRQFENKIRIRKISLKTGRDRTFRHIIKIKNLKNSISVGKVSKK